MKFTNFSEIKNYHNSSQKIRILSENWVGNNIFCPNCGENIKHQHNCKATGFWVNKSKEYNFLLIMHEHLFIFQK